METNVLQKDIEKIKDDLELIKNILLSEGELTDWAKNNLEKTRKENESEYTNLEDL